MGKSILIAVIGLLSFCSPLFAQTAPDSTTHRASGPSRAERGDISGAVADSATGQPLPTIEVNVKADGRFVAGTFTDAFGRFTIHNLPPGSYTVTARIIGYRQGTQAVVMEPGKDGVRADFHLAPTPVQLAQVEVSAASAAAVDVRSGDQRFQASQYHGAPTTTTSQILQQSIGGAARAPTGEVHIRGQHAEYTYFVDGVPVPSGVSGSLNELFDPAIISDIAFKTGGWDAEFGNKNAAIIDVTTRIPSGGHHLDVSGYGGSFNSNGQTLNASANGKTIGVFVSGARQVSDMRVEPVMFDPATFQAINFHNHGEDLSGFGKVQFIPKTSDILNLDLNLSRTHFQVPFDSTGGAVLDDRQEDQNGFANLSWRHRFAGGIEDGQEASRELFAALLYRTGSLKYIPNLTDQPQFIFYPDSVPFNLSENRSFNTLGAKLDYDLHPRHSLEFKTGGQVSTTSGHEDFETVDASGASGPASTSGLSGSDLGIYAQAVLSPSDRLELRPGLRYDVHRAPFAGSQSQLSPRIRLSIFPDAGNSFWIYYGRLFIPTNVEDLRSITSVADSGVVASPTLPERDDFYEAGYVHRFPVGVVAKLSAYYKHSSPGIDDNTVPGSSIVTSVNIDQVHITGIEGVIEVKPIGPLSGYVNAALNHAYGHGPVTGGFFPVETPQGDFDLDHDQRVSIVASATYARRQWFGNATTIYGSGLSNGSDPDASYGTGLFDFNRSIKVAASAIVNLSAGYTLRVGRAELRPQLYVDNLFDRHYLLKGAFFSGASVGRPRSIQAKLDLHL